MKNKPKVGQTLYSLNIGNAARGREQKLAEVEVIKVGRKYFTCSPVGDGHVWEETRYHIDSWQEKAEYLADSRLYETPQEWKGEKEAKKICERIFHIFEYGHNKIGITLSNLRKMEKIIEENE